LLLAIPSTLAAIIIAWRFWDSVAFGISAFFAIVHWFAYATTRSRIVTDPEPSESETPLERGYRSPMFTCTPRVRHRTTAERLGLAYGAWRNRRNTQRVIEWERRLEEKG
jgi:hypothetical protein